MRLKLLIVATIQSIAFFSIFAQEAHAYLDPGTGSYIFQLIIASAIGGLFAIKLFWNKIIDFFKKAFSKNPKR